jgi:hypothetical protein
MANTAGQQAAALMPAIEEIEEVFLEDDTETLGDETPAAKATEEVTAEAEAEAEATTEEETAEEEEADPELTPEQQKAKAFDDLNAAFARDPVAFMRDMAARTMTPEQMAAAGFSVQTAAPATETSGEGWADEDLTAPEKFVKQNAHFIKDLPRFAQGVVQEAQTHRQALIEQSGQIVAMQAQIEALSELAGITLPKITSTTDVKALADYRAAVKAESAKMVAKQKASATRTPSTPRNGAGGGSDNAPVLAAKEGESFQQIFRRAAASARR